MSCCTDLRSPRVLSDFVEDFWLYDDTSRVISGGGFSRAARSRCHSGARLIEAPKSSCPWFAADHRWQRNKRDAGKRRRAKMTVGRVLWMGRDPYTVDYQSDFFRGRGVNADLIAIGSSSMRATRTILSPSTEEESVP